ncbi:MAG: DISARM system SNF2-like helicase DrmD [Lachnospiraceae bacterium]|nr:DISARM system SNF2-like helicase DrmD [Lachnospiraceae bacterium]MDE6252089.1 DISARM system SNF2-like helicase DrmD [Lachnospiraceae bacterium]
MSIVESTYAELKQQKLKKNPLSCLHMADIDINPHQIEAFTFALSSLELGGAILADEVGLGKTIEAGLVIKYLLCSDKNKILLIMPSNLRKQWQVELEEKFDIESLIVDSSNWDDYLTKVKCNQAVIIVSYHFASKRKEEFARIPWDFCVYDEAHRLRNVHKNGSKMANSLYELTKGIPKILLTATPMQNTLLDMYGLVHYIDDKIFYSKSVFSERYLHNEDYEDLKTCLEPIVQRTLRKEVAEYIQFSERKEMTIDFELFPMEIELYVMINNYLKKQILYALPNSHRTLITSVIRKLLASSSMAVAETFKALKGRLEVLKEATRMESADESIDFFLSFFDDDEIETDDDSKQDELYTREKVNEFIQHEIDEVTAIINKAESIKKNAKMTALKQAVEKAFSFQEEARIKQRIVVFTESIRTQQYMYEELSRAGYEGQILKFNGSTNDPVTKQIYKAWKARNYGKYIGSRNVEIKNAIVEAFREEYKILLVTDSGSEGLNLQFCNTIINYDLPWNPQKIEQRIGRCHRYGQKNDVVVINLLNTQNVADKRVYEILSEKFELFQGVFGASDKAIGLLESGADFEKRITLIYQECKTASDFTKQFKALEKELEKKRNKKMDELKSIFIYKTEEQHKAHFNSILQEICEYDSQLEYWNDSKCEKGKATYPKYYEVNVDLEIPRIQHGYLLIGGSYVGSSIEEAVFEIVDETGKIYGVADLLARTLCEKLQEKILKESIPDNKVILSYIDKVDDFMQQKYTKSKRTVIVANQKKMSNWLRLRKEEYLLKTKDTSELDDIKEKYAAEIDFRQKIALKKQIETLEEQKQKLIEAFHDEMSALEEEAANMQKEFEESILVKPQLVTKIVIKF